nr:MAG TPA: hypothetical protein [Caudoviricetes sp.]DAV73914.1 MAG TPA: hypothetical protein [Bacteriophage sp.]
MYVDLDLSSSITRDTVNELVSFESFPETT